MTFATRADTMHQTRTLTTMVLVVCCVLVIGSALILRRLDHQASQLEALKEQQLWICTQ
jgi:hypothetical protein